MQTNPYYEGPGLLVDQPMSKFVVTVIPARVLLNTAYSHRLKAKLQSNGSYHLEGSQRLINPERLKEIGQYIVSHEAAFPNAIILAANFREETGENEDDESEGAALPTKRRWSFELGPDGVSCRLIIPTNEKLAAIIDGQHRLFGFQGLAPDRLEMPLVCAIYFDLPKPYQAYLFATINAKQKPVDKSQTYELFGYSLDDEKPEHWTPDKLAVFLARKLNADSESPLFHHILIPAENNIVPSASAARRAGGWMVSLAVVVEGIVRLISRNPKDDSFKMLGDRATEARLRSRLSDSENTTAPLRQFYLSTNDTVVYTVVRNFFVAVAELFWNDTNPGYIAKTIGIQALFDILRKLTFDAISAKDVSASYFKGRLTPANTINFADDFFQASGTGRTRIRNCIEFATGLRPKADYAVINDGASYHRIVGK